MTATIRTQLPAPPRGSVAAPESPPHFEAAQSGSAQSGSVRSGVSDIAPIALAIIPFGLAVGTAGIAAGLSIGQQLFGGAIMLAGSGQLAAIESIGRGESLLSIALVVALVNLRFVIYGAGTATWYADLPLRRRLLLAYPLVDQTFLLCQQRFMTATHLGWRQRYFLTITALMGGAFVASQAIPHLIGDALPDGLGLHLAAPLTFVSLLAKATKSAPNQAKLLGAGAVSGLVLLLTFPVLGPAALPAGVLAGAALMLVARPTSSSTTSNSTTNSTTNSREAS